MKILQMTYSALDSIAASRFILILILTPYIISPNLRKLIVKEMSLLFQTIIEKKKLSFLLCFSIQ
jgi:hypothetical protein